MQETIKKKEQYTYHDYLQWPDDQRWELINGIAFNMGPAPLRKHQKISGELFSQFYNFLKDKSCEVYYAPFDVRLPKAEEKDEDIQTVVQPDIAIICDSKKLDERGCRGAPDFIIEVTSPATASKDLKDKFYLYEKHKVKEYWIVHPEEKIIMVFLLGKNNEYGKPGIYSENDKIEVNILPGLIISLSFFDL